MRYRKVSVQIWNDAKFRALSDDAKLVFVCLLTHPHMTGLGAMRASEGGIAAELGWMPERLSEAFVEISKSGMAQFDIEACCVWLPRFVLHNQPESPNVVKSWQTQIELIPECELKTLAITAAKGFVENMGEAFRKAFSNSFKAFAKAMPNQEQEQEQEQEQKELFNTDQSGSTSGSRRSPVVCTRSQAESIYQLYPRKVGKPAAVRAIVAAAKRVAADAEHPNHDDPLTYLADRTHAYACSPRGQPPPKGSNDYRPHPSTFFNQGRYDDDPGEWQQPNGDANPKRPNPAGAGSAADRSSREFAAKRPLTVRKFGSGKGA